MRMSREIINLPAEAEPGDLLGREPGQMLWDDEYGYASFLLHQKETQLPRNWSALFQQRPAPEQGSYFLAEWIKTYTRAEAPDRTELNIYMASDFAVTENRGDFSVLLVVGVSRNDDLYLLDLWRGQRSPDVWIDKLLDLVALWKPIALAVEAGQIKSSVGPFLKKRMEERHIYVAQAAFPSRHDKAIRAQSIRARMAVKGLFVPAGALSLADFRAELLGFPSAKWDDQVDALSLIGQIVDQMHAPSPQMEKPQRKVLSMDPNLCTVTLEDLFLAQERRAEAQESDRSSSGA